MPRDGSIPKYVRLSGFCRKPNLMKLIVGLGNPGKQYENSRHNVGFCVVDFLARQWGAALTQRKHHALFASVLRNNEKIALLKPQLFMNCSGTSVVQAVSFYDLRPQDLLVIVDDMALPLGQLRLRPQGSAGGHNGLMDIMEKLGCSDFARLRIGIGPAAPGNAVRHVLGRFQQEEKNFIDHAVKHAAQAVTAWLENDIEQVMTQYN